MTTSTTPAAGAGIKLRLRELLDLHAQAGSTSELPTFAPFDEVFELCPPEWHAVLRANAEGTLGINILRLDNRGLFAEGGHVHRSRWPAKLLAWLRGVEADKHRKAKAEAERREAEHASARAEEEAKAEAASVAAAKAQAQRDDAAADVRLRFDAAREERARAQQKKSTDDLAVTLAAAVVARLPPAVVLEKAHHFASAAEASSGQTTVAPIEATRIRLDDAVGVLEHRLEPFGFCRSRIASSLKDHASLKGRAIRPSRGTVDVEAAYVAFILHVTPDDTSVASERALRQERLRLREGSTASTVKA